MPDISCICSGKPTTCGYSPRSDRLWARREVALVKYVVATAGHVDHGKSTLVRALTGIEPDRWEEERRRGLTIDLGFAWTTLPSGADVAFVDVPGHERYLANTLAGLGAAPAAGDGVGAVEGIEPEDDQH